MTTAPKPTHAAARRRLRDSLFFNVTDEVSRDAIAGIPGIQRVEGGRHRAFTWTLPSLGPEHDFEIGWEMGLAYLRAHIWAGGLDNPEAYDGGGGSLPFIAEALFRGNAPEGHMAAFFDCIATFHDYALNAPSQVMAALVARLLALDDTALRVRCLAVLDGQAVADIFDPVGLGWESRVA